MRVLVTGSSGFAGKHLVRELNAHGHCVIGSDCNQPDPAPNHPFVCTDLCDPDAVDHLVQSCAPDACVHLGGIAYVPAGDGAPETMMAVNLLGTVYLLEAFRRYDPAARMLVVSTAQIYGEHRAEPVDEDAPLAPRTVYATAKAAADLSALAYARRHEMPVMTVRPHNHTGPGQSSRFVVPAMARQIAQIKQGVLPPHVCVGNLESTRSFTDVRDVVRAYRLLLEHGQAGQAYNLAAPGAWRIGDILDELCKRAGVQPKIDVDPGRYRPTDHSVPLQTQKLTTHTGWQAQIPFVDTLRELLDSFMETQ